MTPYGAGEAREWALENMHGQCGCVMPTFRSDLRGINERAIRHDVATEKRYGMTGVLIVAECGTSLDELKQVTDIIVDEAGDDLITIAQASLLLAGLEPRTLSTLHLVFWALVTAVALGTLRRAPDAAAG